jgi:hypothetical protein
MECIEKNSLRKGSSLEKKYQEHPCSPEGMRMNTICVYMQLGKKCFMLDKVAGLLNRVFVFYLSPRLID